MPSEVKGFVQAKLQGLNSRRRVGWSRLTGKPVAHFIHIGKTAGTAVSDALERNLSTGDYTIVLHDHGADLKSVPVGEKAFFFLREPVSRFVSAFYSRQREGQPRRYIPWRPEEAVAFARFKTPNELGLALASGDTRVRAEAEHAMTHIYHVRDSFYRWVHDDAYFQSRLSDILFIGFQEQMESDFELLSRKLGLADSARLPSDDTAAHRTPSSLDKRLDPAAQAAIAAWYARDAQFYAYCKSLRIGR